MLDLQHSFPGKERNEVVYVFARPFFVAFLPTVLIFLVIFLTSLVFQLAIANNWMVPISNSDANALVLFIGLFQLLSLIIFLTALLDFYFDILIVTDRRLVDIDQEQLLLRRISELNLQDVQDVSSSVAGFLPHIFNYGAVHIQTAGTRENFEAINFRFPREIASIISDLAEQAKAGVAVAARKPEGATLGMIEDTPLTSFNQLVERGAAQPDDPRRG